MNINPKVKNGTGAAGVVFALGQAANALGAGIPDEVINALSVVATFVAGYFTTA
jgi:hypothetical protein